MTSGIIAGCIRWDAWYSSSGVSSLQGQQCLGPAAWQGRAPWFTQVVSPFKIVAAGTQANMDAELTYASGVGIKYFAYDDYKASSGRAELTDMTTAWGLHQASTNKNLVNWCWMTFSYQWGAPTFGDNSWQTYVNGWVAQFQQSNYQKVLSGRPLIYIFYSASDLTGYFASSLANFASAVSYLRAQCTAASVPNPYIVLVFTAASTAASVAASIGADAISAYNPPIVLSAIPDTYANLDTLTQASWVTQAAAATGAGVKLVPNAITGWDQRARFQNPETFAPAKLSPFRNYLQYFTPPSDAAVAAHLSALVAYINANATVCNSTAALIYSWTECTEGANPLIPTLAKPPPSTLLAAIAPVIT